MTKSPTVALIDVIGLTYDPTTLDKFGLGGSESAIIYMGRELQALGFEVTVFNNCVDSRAKPGVYDGVTYRDLRELHKPNDYTFDVMITSRTVIPYLEQKDWGNFNYPFPTNPFAQMKAAAKLKLLWLHDTFCSGDHLVEQLLMNGDIDEVFTLSDFHTSYITTCAHGRKRNFEVLKDKVFMTRNGARKFIDEVDILAKDKNLFVYNASVTKGMIPLLELIWPQVKKHIPAAKLTVIGGFYRFRDGAAPDAQEEKFHKFANDPKLKQLDVTFTGVIPQRDIGDILAKASYMIFPGAFPETFGISTLESLLYNTPLLTTRFGALEETAVELACYKIDYAIEPNSLYPDINFVEQCNKFVAMTVNAYNTPYLHAQKMQYCNIVHDICSWGGVALQWKQHLFKKLGLFMPVDEYREVMKLNQRIHEVYGRRFSNTEEWPTVKTVPEQPIVVVTPFYNSEAYIESCIRSVAAQDYDNYRMVLVDDKSTDDSYLIAKKTIESLPPVVRDKFELHKNKTNRGAVYNQVTTIRGQEVDSIIMMLDGDDWLVNDNSIFQYYNTIYDGTTEFTYGSCWSLVDNIPLIGQPYPLAVKQSKSYRQYRFAWNMPYTHLRTFYKGLITQVKDEVFKDDEGKWLRAGGDTAIFYNILEAADPTKVKALQKIVYNYNDMNPLNDYKVNGDEQTRTANKVLGVQDVVVLHSLGQEHKTTVFPTGPIDLRRP